MPTKPLIYDFQTLAYYDFSNRDLTGVSFRGAELTGANFSNSKINNCNFDKATLKDADFRGTGFTLYEIRVYFKLEYKDVLVLAKTEKEAQEIAPCIEGEWKSLA